MKYEGNSRINSKIGFRKNRTTMEPRPPRFWLVSCVLAVAAQGCDSLHRSAPYREDPLLVGRKLVVAKPEEAKPHQLAFAEPALPSLPAFAYVYPPPGLKSLAGDAVLADKRPVPTPPQAHPREPAVQSPDTAGSDRANSPVQALPVLRRRVLGTFGHAPDYSWLQGRVRRSPSGSWELTFCESPTEVRCGGRVFLEDEARFEQLQDCQVIQVEGYLRSAVHVPGIPGLEAPATYRVDRISSIR
jgi:hypothetical protein